MRCLVFPMSMWTTSRVAISGLAMAIAATAGLPGGVADGRYGDAAGANTLAEVGRSESAPSISAPSMSATQGSGLSAAGQSTLPTDALSARPGVGLRKLHLVRPDLIPYPIAYEIYC